MYNYKMYSTWRHQWIRSVQCHDSELVSPLRNNYWKITGVFALLVSNLMWQDSSGKTHVVEPRLCCCWYVRKGTWWSGTFRFVKYGCLLGETFLTHPTLQISFSIYQAQCVIFFILFARPPSLPHISPQLFVQILNTFIQVSSFY